MLTKEPHIFSMNVTQYGNQYRQHLIPTNSISSNTLVKVNLEPQQDVQIHTAEAFYHWGFFSPSMKDTSIKHSNIRVYSKYSRVCRIVASIHMFRSGVRPPTPPIYSDSVITNYILVNGLCSLASQVIHPLPNSKKFHLSILPLPWVPFWAARILVFPLLSSLSIPFSSLLS